MSDEPVKITQYVNTGEVKSGGIETILNSGAIGSCVVITAFDPVLHIGAMAHVMLPGKSPQERTLNSLRYASDAVDELLNQLTIKGVQTKNVRVCMAGGANVLQRKNDTIGLSNVASVEGLLKEARLETCAKSVGGIERRTMLFYVESASVCITIGDSKEKLLWKFEK